MAIVRPTVGGYVADPRAAADEAKWNKIHANTGRLAAMIPQAMLRQYAIDEALRAADERQKAAAVAKELEKVDWGSKTGAFARLDQDLQKGLQVTDQADVDAMKAFGAAGAPKVTIQSVDPQVGPVTQSAEDRLAKMLRARDVAEANAVEVPLDAATIRRLRSPEQVAQDERMMAFDRALIQDQQAEMARQDAAGIARANAEVEAMRQMMGAAPTAPNIPAGTPVVRPQVERAPASSLEGSPLEGYRGPQTTATTVAMPEAQAAEFVRAQVMADPGLRAAIENDEMVATFWMSATNAERMALIEEIKKKTAEARMFGESPSRVAR